MQVECLSREALCSFIDMEASIDYIKKDYPQTDFKQCQLNKHGDYDVSLADLVPGQSYQFYDDQTCILDIIATTEGVDVQSHTVQQINVVSDIATATLSIYSDGPVLFAGKVTADNLNLTTTSVCFADDVTVSALEVKAEAGVALLAPLTASICKFDCDVFLQEQVANISASSCCILTDELYLNATVDVEEKAFITADSIEVDSADADPIAINLPANSYLRGSSCEFDGNSALTIHEQQSSHAKICLDYLTIDSQAKLSLAYTELEAKTIKNKGALSLENVALVAENLRQQGHLECEAATVATRNMTIDGATCFGESEVEVKRLIVKSDKCTFNGETQVDTETLMVAEGANLKVDNASIDVERKFSSVGSCSFEGAELNADDAYFYNEPLVAINSKFTVGDNCHVDAGVQLDSMKKFRAQSLSFSGDVSAVDSQLSATSLEFDADSVALTQCRINSTRLSLKDCSDSRPAVVSDCNIKTHVLQQSGALELCNSSTLYGVAGEDSHFFFDGDVLLDDSRILTQGNIYCKDKTYFSSQEGLVFANQVLNTAECQLDKSLLFTDTLIQDRASLGARDSLLDVSKQTISHESAISAQDSNLSLGQASHSGAVSLAESKLVTEGVEIDAQQGEVAVDHASISDGAIKFEENTQISNARLFAQEVSLYDSFDIDSALVKAKKDIKFEHSATGAVKKSIVHAQQNLISSAEIILEQSTLQADAKLRLEAESVTKVKDQSILKADYATLAGSLIKEDEQTPASVKMEVGHDLLFSNSSDVDLDTLLLMAERTKNEGLLAVRDSLTVDGQTFYNENSISADQMMLKLDRGLVCNIGSSIITRTLGAQANIINFGGLISARERYHTEGFFHFNAGLIASSNAHVNSLVSLNGGLVLPHLTDPRDCFNMNNLYMAGRTAAGIMLPGYKGAMDFALSLPGTWASIDTLGNALDKKGLSGILNMRAHEIMPLACKAKNTAMSAVGAYKQATKLPAALPKAASGTYDSLSKYGVAETCKSAIYDVDWHKLGKQTLGVMGGHYVDDSIAHFNVGATFSQSTSKTNFFHFNAGVEHSFQNHSIDTRWGYNYGTSSGYESSFRATQSMSNYGDLSGSHSMHLDIERLHNAESGEINGTNLRGHIKDLQQEGVVDWQDGAIEIDHYHESASAQTYLEDMAVKGETAAFAGLMRSKGVAFDFKESIDMEKSADIKAEDTGFKAKVVRDAGHLHCQKSVSVEAEHYEHDGHLTGGAFSAKAKTATLAGSADIAKASYDVEHLEKGDKFVAGSGRFAKYKFSDVLVYKTEDAVKVESMQRDCDLSVEAKAIDWSAAVKNKRMLDLKSTEGDITITECVEVANLFVDSKKDVYMNRVAKAHDIARVVAEGGLYNLGGTLTANSVQVIAAEIFNITHGSDKAKEDWKCNIGAAGIINGIKDVLLEATEGNIENHGGMIRGGDYAQLLAKKDVKNLCNVRTSQGKHDTIKEFDAGLIAGGSGTETEGTGLVVKAGGKVLADASDFTATGDAYIEGIEGVEFKARSHTYVSKDEFTRKWYGKKKHVVETSTNVRGCNVQSSTGRNIVISDNGGVTGTAVNFVSPGGTDIFAKKEVALFSLKTQDHRHVKKSNLWGLSKSKKDEWHERSTVSLLLDNGTSRIHSLDESVDLRGAYLGGSGDLEIEAKKKIIFGCDVLNHHEKEKTKSFGITAPGMGAFNAMHNGGNVWDALSAEEACFAKFNSLCGSENLLESAANASNLGIELFNTTNSLMRGISQDQLGAEAMARYGLGGSDGFDPRLGLTYTETRSDSRYQTLGLGGVNRGGNASYKASEGIELHNGVEVYNDGDTDVNAPKIEAHAAQLKSSYRHEEKSVNLGVTASGEVVDAGASYSREKASATEHVNASLSSGGHMHLHHNGEAVDRVDLGGANLEAKTLDAEIKTLIIEDKLDRSKSKSDSGSASASGAVSFATSKGSSAEVKQRSGIHVTEGLNTQGHTFKVEDAHMKGGAIITDGENKAEIGHLETEEVHEYREQTGFGFSGNVTELTDKFVGEPTQQPGSKAIATGSLSVQHQCYQAKSKSVIYGAEGIDLEIKEQVVGSLHATSADGREVLEDTKLTLKVDVPVTNEQHMCQAVQNIKDGSAKLKEKFTQPSDKKVAAVKAEMSALKEILKSVEDGDFEPPLRLKQYLALVKATYGEVLSTEQDGLEFVDSFQMKSVVFGDYRVVVAKSDDGLVVGIEGTSEARNWLYNFAVLPKKAMAEMLAKGEVPKVFVSLLFSPIASYQAACYQVSFLQDIHEKLDAYSEKYHLPVAGIVGHSAGASISDSMLKVYYPDAYGVLFNGYETSNSDKVVNLRTTGDSLSAFDSLARLSSPEKHYTAVAEGGHGVDNFDAVADLSWTELKEKSVELSHKNEQERLSDCFAPDQYKAKQAALEQLRSKHKQAHTPGLFSANESLAQHQLQAAAVQP